ncbi:Ger(x)C family spore germination protein [Paenibacillus glycanilyticus]|uniref:Ger(x)C family spore germination protein n=1 Tax=Paenibacillus glycanilyticus TaxID=126569 RepID=UPI00203F83B6|nr:Ger(x)C family spore germination protein [Paenibacillus glycanilyticus]MCM3626651.1 Ger(x)C family spore germination protein [Paenibacillus glycanilyticus]
MKKTIKKWLPAVWIGLLSLSVSGCWDIHYLVNKKIVNGISLDKQENGQLRGTVKAIILESKGGGQFNVKDKVAQATGGNLPEIGHKIDSMLPGTIEANKAFVIIIGDELAKQGIMPALEFFYRLPKAYLNTKVLIAKGNAAEILNVSLLENNPIAFDIKQMVQGSERTTLVPDQTLYSLWNQVSDPAEDTVLPMIRKIDHDTLVIDSTGLFNGDIFTGITLSREDSILLLLMNGKLSKVAWLDIPLDRKSHSGKADVVSFEVRKIKRKLEVSVNKDMQAIESHIRVDLYSNIDSYTSSPDWEIDSKQLSKELETILDKRASKITRQLLKANCDAFGIGRKLKASHTALWNSIDWKSKYPEVKLTTEIHVHITSTGALK